MSEQPLSVPELCKAARISSSAFYRRVDKGYKMQWPEIKRTSLKHFLAWCETTHDTPKPKDDRKAKEMAELASR